FMRGVDVALNTSASSSVNQAAHIYLESGTTSGTISDSNGVMIASLQAGGVVTYGFRNTTTAPNLDGSTTFASLPTANAHGFYVYCSDCKSVADGATAGWTAVGGGTGAFVFRQNGVWKIHG